MKVKILIPIYNDWKSVFKLLENMAYTNSYLCGLLESCFYYSLYEVNYLVEFVIYDDSNFKLANTIVEANRTTTSGKYISLIETERIIDDMIYKCLKDFSNKAKELIKDHMNQYTL